MPPKRKRAEDDGEPSTSSTRATRSSTRQTTAKSPDPPAQKKSTKKTNTKVGSMATPDDEIPPPPKKTKKPTAKSTIANKKAGAKTKAQPPNDDVKGEFKGELGRGTEKKEKQLPTPLAIEPYSTSRVQALFSTYADKDDPETIGAENFGRLCTDADIPMEGAMPLILFWQLGAKELGNISKTEWINGLESLKISSLSSLRIFLAEVEDLLLTNSPPKSGRRDGESYDPAQYMIYASDRKGSFTKLYLSCFQLVRPGQSRNIEMETAVAFWSVLLAPQYPIISEVIAFINEKGCYRAANKDVWSMMLEFCRTVDPNLENYETDGAWPTLIDDFVGWKKERTGGKEGDEKQTEN